MAADALDMFEKRITTRVPGLFKRRHIDEILAANPVTYAYQNKLIKKKQLGIGHQIGVQFTLPTIISYQTTIFSTAPSTDIDFELKYMPHWHVHDNKSFFLQVSLQETGKLYSLVQYFATFLHICTNSYAVFVPLPMLHIAQHGIQFSTV